MCDFSALKQRGAALTAVIRSIVTAARCIFRGLLLLAAARPRTPLRVMCIMAFDALHRLRHAKPLPKPKLRTLAALLDLGACANAVFDHKPCSRGECRGTLEVLEQEGIRPPVAEYLHKLRSLEVGRPLPGGDDRQFRKVGLYREAVVRLSLGMAATTVRVKACLDEAVRATYCDADLNLLFRIVMQCQIIDDVLDYAKDLAAGLPSFLTASRSLPQALELTSLAAQGYADDRDLPRTGDVFPLRSALFLVSICTKLVIALARWRQGHHLVARATPA